MLKIAFALGSDPQIDELFEYVEEDVEEEPEDEVLLYDVKRDDERLSCSWH